MARALARPPSVAAASCWGRRRALTTTSASASAAAATPVGTKLTITRPDDWHLHVRDGATLSAVVPHTARVFGRAIIMPNLNPPVRTLSEAVCPAALNPMHLFSATSTPTNVQRCETDAPNPNPKLTPVSLRLLAGGSRWRTGNG